MKVKYKNHFIDETEYMQILHQKEEKRADRVLQLMAYQQKREREYDAWFKNHLNDLSKPYKKGVDHQ